MKRTINVLKGQYNNIQSEFSQNIFNFNEQTKRSGEMYSHVVKLTEMKATFENTIEMYKSKLKEALNELEKYNGPLSAQIKSEFKDDIHFLKNVLPEQITIQQKAEPIPIPTVNPGQPLK